MADQVSVCWNWMSSGLPCVFAYKYSWPYILNANLCTVQPKPDLPQCLHTECCVLECATVQSGR